MRFEYKIEHGEATLIRCYGSGERVSVPEELDGYPVTALAPYAFSAGRREPDAEQAVCGEQVREIILPGSIRRVGQYAFYGCSRLERLTFSHKEINIAGGVFMGCRRLKELVFRMDDPSGYVMKSILSDFRLETKVVLEYPDGRAVLWFPEYYEEAVENTPARNVDTCFHGAGYMYRQCFQDGVFRYAEYDRSFMEATYLESEDFCIELALMRLIYPRELSEDSGGAYRSYLIEHRMSAALWCIEFDQEEHLLFLASFIRWREEELEQLIGEAHRHERLSMQSFLMDHKHRNYAKKRKTFEW